MNIKCIFVLFMLVSSCSTVRYDIDIDYSRAKNKLVPAIRITATNLSKDSIYVQDDLLVTPIRDNTIHGYLTLFRKNRQGRYRVPTREIELDLDHLYMIELYEGMHQVAIEPAASKSYLIDFKQFYSVLGAGEYCIKVCLLKDLLNYEGRMSCQELSFDIKKR